MNCILSVLAFLMSATLNFTIVDEPCHLHTHRLMDLCEFLTARVIEPFLARQGVRWERDFQDFLTPAGQCSPFDAKGTLIFRPPPMFLGQLGELEQGIVSALVNAGIGVGPLEREESDVPPVVKIVRIPIEDNPTWDSGPPEVNMSETAGRIVLRDLLGYWKADGRYIFGTDDILCKVRSVTEKQIQGVSRCPSLERLGTRRILALPNPTVMRRVRRCLEEVERFAQWAKAHHYQKLSAS